MVRTGQAQQSGNALQVFETKMCKEISGLISCAAIQYQVLPITDSIARIILAAGSAVYIAEQAQKDGVWDLRRSGLEKVKAGLTSLEEVNSVTIE